MLKRRIPSVLLKMKLLALLFCFSFTGTTLLGQNTYLEEIDLKVRTTGQLVKANKLIMIVEVEIPEGWKLKVENGFESMWEDGVDTVDMALKYREKPEYKLIQRLKADRKPSPKGYYYDKVTFAQTIRIDTSKLPINVDAELKWVASRLDEKKGAQGQPCCLLQVCEKRENKETLRVGWNCTMRNKVYLEDILK